MTRTFTGVRTLTALQLVAEAHAAFGDDRDDWAFRCPNCGDVATMRDFRKAGADPQVIGQECIGRQLLAVPGPAPRRGCDWAAYGLIPGPWQIQLSGGKTMASFALAVESKQDKENAGGREVGGGGAVGAGAAAAGGERPVAEGDRSGGVAAAGGAGAVRGGGVGAGMSVTDTREETTVRVPPGLIAHARVARTADRIGACPLTAREVQVLVGMSYGHSNAGIGGLLELSEDTVKTHARRLFQKLKVADRAQAVRVGFEVGLLALETQPRSELGDIPTVVVGQPQQRWGGRF